MHTELKLQNLDLLYIFKIKLSSDFHFFIHFPTPALSKSIFPWAYVSRVIGKEF